MSTSIVKKRQGYYTIEATRYSGGKRGLRGQITMFDGSNWTTIDLSKAEMIDFAVKIIDSMNELDLKVKTINRPVAFNGSQDEKDANRRTHDFRGIDYRCMMCDCKPWHAAADYPCGTEPPRETVMLDDD